MSPPSRLRGEADGNICTADSQRIAIFAVLLVTPMAAAVAGPPSPENEALPFPAIVWIVPVESTITQAGYRSTASGPFREEPVGQTGKATTEISGTGASTTMGLHVVRVSYPDRECGVHFTRHMPDSGSQLEKQNEKPAWDVNNPPGPRSTVRSIPAPARG
jgi:hypothetical protein